MNQQHVKVVDIAYAEEFLERLDPLYGADFKGGYFPSNMLFRGHAHSRWPLLPSALRKSSFSEVGQWSRFPCDSNVQQICAETKWLLKFFNKADHNGLPMPEDSQRLRTLLVSLTDERNVRGYITELSKRESLEEKFLWPPNELLSLIAIAQHHRIPTRLLDWTTSSLIAAYFAASEAARWLYKTHGHYKPADVTHLCVWALLGDLFDLNKIVSDKQSKIALVTTPAAGNPRLHAQKGCFLVNRVPNIDPDGSVDTRPWDETLREDMGFMDGTYVLLQYRLPIGEAERLLRLLAFREIDAATIEPGFDGVVKSLEENKYWESSEDFHEKARARKMPKPSGG